MLETLSTVFASTLLNDNTSTPASAVGITEINQISDTNAQHYTKKQIKNKLLLIELLLVIMHKQRLLVLKQVKLI